MKYILSYLAIVVSCSVFAGDEKPVQPSPLKHSAKDACEYISMVADLASWSDEFVTHCSNELNGLSFKGESPVDDIKIEKIAEECFEKGSSSGDEGKDDKEIKTCLFSKLVSLGKSSAK